MIILISPAKTQDYTPLQSKVEVTQAEQQNKISQLVAILKQYTPKELEKTLGVSKTLATLNHQRYQAFNTKHYTLENAKPALFAYQGDVYRYLQAEQLSKSAIKFLQQHLLILSGLYGYLKPLDLIQPYRLEMQAPLTIKGVKSLHDFWKESITTAINTALAKQKNKTIINLASQEYFKAVDLSRLTAPVITIHFKEVRQGKLRTIALNAKRARGMMVRFIADNKLDQPQQLQQFQEGNYKYNSALSNTHDWVFCREG